MSEDMSEEPNSAAETPMEQEAEAQSLGEEDTAGSEAQSEVQDGTEGVTSVTEQSDDSTVDRLSRPPSIFTLAKKEVSDPCWYCMMSLLREDLNLTQPHLEQLESDASTAPSADKTTPTYQTDPRPHFGIPNSSRSTPFPLWGIRGPRERRKGDEEEEGEEEVCMCPHCNLSCPADTLRWHEAKCLIFEGLKNMTEQQQSTH